MRQTTVRSVVTAAAMLTDEQKAAIAKGEPQTITLTKGERSSLRVTVAFTKRKVKVTFGLDS